MTTTDDPRRDRLELWSAILLGLAALAAAFTAYQAALSDGDAVQGYTTAIQQLSDANFFYTQGNQQFAQDNQLFLNYVQAVERDETDVALYIRSELMSDNLQEAMDYWESSDATTPFDAESPYAIESFAPADESQESSTESFAEGADADEQGDTYELAGVLLAVSLFLGGIVSFFRRRGIANLLLGLGATSLVGGVALALTA